MKGTPTDCVIMGVRHILADKRPDLVLSGVNRGQNIAEDVTYSGTVAGAMEATILGIPALALSQVYGPDERTRELQNATAEKQPPISSAVCSRRVFPRRPHQRQFSRLRAASGRSIAIRARPPQPGASAHRAAPRRSRQSVLLDRVSRGSWTPQNGSDLQAIAGKQHCSDAASSRHDRRAVHDAARCSVRIKRAPS